jgi:hypothetical protein
MEIAFFYAVLGVAPLLAKSTIVIPGEDRSRMRAI